MARLTERTELPEPVRRYLRHVQAWAHAPIRQVRLSQRGVLRTGAGSRRWMRFEAKQHVEPDRCAFAWEARVRALPGLYLHVRDAYERGAGSGQVRVLGARVASDADRPELNAAALHRYLAEAVWYPTALLPAAGVRWTAVDDARALASLTHGGSTVELEFRFNAANEVSVVRASGRWQRTRGGYRQVPWEARLSEYRSRQGLRIPMRAEVGWEADRQVAIVWKGEVTSAQYEFQPQ